MYPVQIMHDFRNVVLINLCMRLLNIHQLITSELDILFTSSSKVDVVRLDIICIHRQTDGQSIIHGVVLGNIID